MTRTIEYMRLDDFIARFHPDNPKAHNIPAIKAAFDRFGFKEQPLLDETTGMVAAGHGRAETLKQQMDKGDTLPKDIEQDTDGMWMLPVTRGVHFEDDAELKAYLIASNQLTMDGGWHDDRLGALLQGLKSQDKALFEATGFNDAKLGELLASITPSKPQDDPGAQVDRAEELNEKWQVKRGDLWVIPSKHGGEHRLLCGDSTVKEDVDRVINGLVTPLMVTDPPYGVDYDQDYRSSNRTGKVTNDDRSDWSDAYKLFDGDVIYCWHADRYSSQVQQSLESLGFEIRAQIIWAKPRLVMSRGHYHWQHEPCWYAFRKGKTAGWIGDHSQTTLWSIPMNDDVDMKSHGTQKPVECMARPIRNHQGNVYDPFGGSGTTMVACEQLGRQCRMIEIEEKYVAVILERMSGMGLEPIKKDTLADVSVR